MALVGWNTTTTTTKDGVLPLLSDELACWRQTGFSARADAIRFVPIAPPLKFSRDAFSALFSFFRRFLSREREERQDGGGRRTHISGTLQCPKRPLLELWPSVVTDKRRAAAKERQRVGRRDDTRIDTG